MISFEFKHKTSCKLFRDQRSSSQSFDVADSCVSVLADSVSLITQLLEGEVLRVLDRELVWSSPHELAIPDHHGVDAAVEPVDNPVGGLVLPACLLPLVEVEEGQVVPACRVKSSLYKPIKECREGLGVVDVASGDPRDGEARVGLGESQARVRCQPALQVGVNGVQVGGQACRVDQPQNCDGSRGEIHSLQY